MSFGGDVFRLLVSHLADKQLDVTTPDLDDGDSRENRALFCQSAMTSTSPEALSSTNLFQCAPLHVRIKSTAQPAVRRQHHQQRLAAPARRQQRVRTRLTRASRCSTHIRHAVRIGPRRHHAVLSPLQLCRRHHLHGVGDLLRIFNAGNPSTDVSSDLAWLRSSRSGEEV